MSSIKVIDYHLHYGDLIWITFEIDGKIYHWKESKKEDK